MKYPTECRFIEVKIDTKNNRKKGGYIKLRSEVNIEIYVVIIATRT